MPPTSFGYLRRSSKTRPVSTRSGENTSWNPSPATSPDPCSSMGAYRVRVVPTGRVVSYETNVPGLRPVAMAWVAASIQPKSGRPSSSTNSGTTTTTTSDWATAATVSVVAVSRPRPDHVAQLLRQARLTRERLDPSVHQLDRLGVDVGTDHLVALRGELDGQRQADLAQRHDADPHSPSTFGSPDDDRPTSRRGLGRRVGNRDCGGGLSQRHDVRVLAQEGVAEALVLDSQRLWLRVGEPDHVPLGDTPESGDFAPLGRDDPVLEEGEVRGQGVGHERPLLARDDRDALLHRREPVDQVIRHSSVGQLPGDGDQVLMRPTRAIRRTGCDGGEGLLGDPRGQVDVVGGQVEDDPHVGDPAREGALASGGDLVDLAQVAIGDPAAGLLQRRVVALDVTDGTQRARLRRRRRRSRALTRHRWSAASRSGRAPRLRPGPVRCRGGTGWGWRPSRSRSPGRAARRGCPRRGPRAGQRRKGPRSGRRCRPDRPPRGRPVRGRGCGPSCPARGGRRAGRPIRHLPWPRRSRPRRSVSRSAWLRAGWTGREIDLLGCLRGLGQVQRQPERWQGVDRGRVVDTGPDAAFGQRRDEGIPGHARGPGSCTGGRRAPRPRRRSDVTTPSRLAVRNAAFA